eukprot:100908-Pelagomonas_calceolata.AAC.9
MPSQENGVKRRRKELWTISGYLWLGEGPGALQFSSFFGERLVWFNLRKKHKKEHVWQCGPVGPLCNIANSLYCEAFSKGKFGSFLVAMDACFRDKLQEQGIEVPENIPRIIPED